MNFIKCFLRGIALLPIAMQEIEVNGIAGLPERRPRERGRTRARLV